MTIVVILKGDKMNTVKECYEALLAGDTLVSEELGAEHGVFLSDEGELVNVKTNEPAYYGFTNPTRWHVFDKFEDLKRAYAECAVIEFHSEREGWFELTLPIWRDNNIYRIKDGITIEQWDEHEELIKAYWEGAEIEVKYRPTDGWSPAQSPQWHVGVEYRIKEEMAMMIFTPPEVEIIRDGLESLLEECVKDRKECVGRGLSVDIVDGYIREARKLDERFEEVQV